MKKHYKIFTVILITITILFLIYYLLYNASLTTLLNPSSTNTVNNASNKAYEVVLPHTRFHYRWNKTPDCIFCEHTPLGYPAPKRISSIYELPSLPSNYTINTPDKLQKLLIHLLQELGVDPKLLGHCSYKAIVYVMNWSIYGFNNNSIITYVWSLSLSIYDESIRPIMWVDVDALTGAITKLDIYPGFYQFLDKYPKYVTSQRNLTYYTLFKGFNSMNDLMSYIDKLLSLLNVDKNIYLGTLTSFPEPLVFPYNEPSIELIQVYNDKIVFATPLTRSYYSYAEFSISFTDYKGDKRLYRINNRMLPLKYLKIIEKPYKISSDEAVEKVKSYLATKYNVPPQAFLNEGLGVWKTYYWVKPGTLENYWLVRIYVAGGGRYAVFALVDPETGIIVDLEVI